MDFLGIIFFLLIISGVWRLIVSGGASALSAAQGEGTFSENMSLRLQGMGQLEIRKIDFRAGEGEDGPHGVGLELRGLMPVARRTQLGFVTSVLDVTEEGNPRPVLASIEMFQEPESAAYYQFQGAGEVGPDEGFVSWVRVGGVFPELLYPAYGGRRQLVFVIRLVDLGQLPPIQLGFGDGDHPGLLASLHVGYELGYEGKGYLDAAEHRDEARALAIRLAMAVAIADGTLHESEGNVIKTWVTKTIAAFGDPKRDELKSIYNDAMRDAFAAAKAGELSLSEVTGRLNEIAEEPQKYEAIELCFDVMAADGVADESELASIRRIAEALQLDYQEIENLRDKRLITLDVALEHRATLETIIGIEDGWDQDRIKTHIRIEYAKWNDRLNNLPEGQERENAQRMLDMLSEARKKYA